MERRDFLLKGCTLAIGGTLVTSLLQSCHSIPVFKTLAENKMLKVPLDQFTENNYLIVKPTNVSYNVAVIKKNENDFQSMMMVCTHADNPLRFNGKEFRCSLHGSLFNKNGNVEKGPAEKSLTLLKTKVENNYLTINLI